MKTAGEMFEDAILHWRENRCVGSAIIPPPLNDKVMILGVLQRIYARSPTSDVIIITNTFQERIDLIEFLTTQPEDDENNDEFKKLLESKTLKVFSIDLIKKGYDKIPYVAVVYHCVDMCDNLVRLLNLTKFRLVVLNKLMVNNEDMLKLYSSCPLLPDFKQNEIDEIRINTPVEEVWVDISIDETSEDKKLLDYYNEYITTSISIFGNFELIKEARVGNTSLNISAAEICNQIAYDNGWNEHLDMNIPYNIQIDNIYNPANIRDRATQTYEIIRNRSKLLSDYSLKLDKIFDIIKENPDARILIINKNGEFASKVTDYINNLSETIICGNYHDKVDAVPALDEDGNPIYYKSGSHKGERKYIAAKAQKSLNERLFNSGKLKVLSTNAAPDKDISICVDIVIITSPQCDDMKSYIYRLSKVNYPNGIIKLYSLYVRNSIEETKLENKITSENHKIVNKCKNRIVSENNSDFVIVD